jgi:hypothetical protein
MMNDEARRGGARQANRNAGRNPLLDAVTRGAGVQESLLLKKG